MKNHALEKYFKETDIDLEKIMEENEKVPGRIKGISEKATPEESKKALSGKKTKEEEQDEETQVIEQDLEEQGEDLKLSKYRGIKDSHIHERMPEVFKDGQESGIAYSNKLHRFVIISKENGKFQINENAEPARMTWKTIISIDEKGEQVEKKVPYALMKLPNNPEKEIAVTIDDYGIVDIETVDVLPEQKRLTRQVEVEGEGKDGQETRKMRREFQTQGKYHNREIAKGVEEVEKQEIEQGKSIDNKRTEEDYIEGVEPPMTWGELMEETGESLPELLERYDREMDKPDAKPQDVIDTIEQDYDNVNRQIGTN